MSKEQVQDIYSWLLAQASLDILVKMFSLLCVNVHVGSGFWYAYNTGQELGLLYMYKATVYSSSTYVTPLLCVTCTALTDCLMSVGAHVEWRNTDCQVLSLTATATHWLCVVNACYSYKRVHVDSF